MQFCNGDFPSEQDKRSFNKQGDTTSQSRVVTIDNVRTHLIIHRFNEKDERSTQQSALWDSWYRFADVIIIVYTVTSHSSFLLARSFFDKIQQSRQKNLLPPASGGAGIQGLDPNRHLNSASRPTAASQPVIILGNKADLAQKRQVNRQEAIFFAQAHGIIHMESDARSKLNVDNVFVQAARMAQYSRDGVVRNGGLVTNPWIESTRSPAISAVSPSSSASSVPTTPAPAAPTESRLGRFFQMGRRRGSSAAAALNNSNTTTAPSTANRRVSKDEGIESAPERALEYHRAGSRGGGGGGGGGGNPFISFGSPSSRWGASRDNHALASHHQHQTVAVTPTGSMPTNPPAPWPQHQSPTQDQQRSRLDKDVGGRFELSTVYRRNGHG